MAGANAYAAKFAASPAPTGMRTQGDAGVQGYDSPPTHVFKSVCGRLLHPLQHDKQRCQTHKTLISPLGPTKTSVLLGSTNRQAVLPS